MEDPTGKLELKDIEKTNMQNLDGVLSAGFSDTQIWMRLRIDPTKAKINETDQIYLRIRPLYIDEIILYDPLQIPSQRNPVGDYHPVSGQAEPATTFLLTLPAGIIPRDIWLRIKTTSTRLVYADVLTARDLRSSDYLLNHLGSFYLGLIAVFFLWGIINFSVRQEPLMLSFIFYQGSWLLMGASFLGYNYLYLSNGWLNGNVDLVTNILILSTTASVLIFSHFLLNELGPARWRRNVMAFFILMYPILFFLVFNGNVSLALEINMLIVLLVPIVMWVLALISKYQPSHELDMKNARLSKAIVIGYFSLTVVFTISTSLPALGLITGAEISLYVAFFYSLVSGLLMVLMLKYRTWQNIHLQSQLRAIAEVSRKQADDERSFRLERERLLAMLGHELKTPLATIRMLLADRQVPEELAKALDDSVREMKHVVELAVESGQIESGGIKLNVRDFSITQLIVAVCDDLSAGERVDIKLHGIYTPQISTDFQLLKVVIRNLLDNALKYSPKNSHVQVNINFLVDLEQWSISVTNQVGQAGFPDPARLFEKYYRGPKASNLSGTGLGLYLVKGLTSILGGGFQYEPRKSSVCFSLTLPNLKTEQSEE